MQSKLPIGLLFLGFALSSCSTTISGDSPEAQPSPDAALQAPSVDAAPVPEPDAAPQVLPCVEGDSQMSSSDETCYMLFRSALDWNGAQAACIAVGATLAVIDDADEQLLVGALSGQILPEAPDSWLGATDEALEANFVWVDGTALVFNNFRSGEPNNSGPNGTPENCLIIEGDNPAREWDDRTCVALFPYICERAPNSAP